MNFLSLFSGIEAASVAWEPLGWKAVAFSEIDEFPCAVLKHHYPSVPNLGDVTKFHEWPNYEADVLVGGSPCQAFSLAGLRKGLDDPRGNLTLTYLGAVNKIRPRWVVWENVPGVLSIDGGRTFAAFLRGLAECGYGFAYRILNAQYFGVAQRRRRVFVVGHIGGDWRRAAAVLLEAINLRAVSAPSRKMGEEIAGTISTIAISGQSTSGGLIWGNNGKPFVRIFTLKEVERLMGFPDDYTLIPYHGKGIEFCPTTARHKALGNSICVPVLKWIGERIQAVDLIR